MKIDYRKMSVKQIPMNSVLVSIGSFFVAFVIQMFFVFKWNFFRYPYEEFQIMAMGAQSYGNSWDSLIASAPYGGIFFIPIYRLLFRLGISGTAAYRVMRWGLAIINAVPAFIVSRIANRVYKLGDIKSSILGIIAVLAATSRASSVRSEVFISLLTWVLVYELITFIASLSVKEKNIHSGIIGAILALMPFCNVKTVVLIPAAVISIILIKVFKKRWLVSLPAFVPSFLFVGGVCNLLVDQVLINFSAGQDWEISWTIEMKEYLYSIVRGIQRLHMSHGVRGFFDLFISNLWIIAIFSCGIVIYAFAYMFKRLCSGKEQGDFESGVLLFLESGTVFSIVALSFSGIRNGIYIHTRGGAPDWQFFSIGTYGYLICPILLIGIMVLLKRGKDQIRLLIPSMSVIVLSSIYLIVSVIVPALKNGHTSMKWWFGYETSFLVMLNQWADKETGVWFFVFPTAIVLFLMWCYHASKDYKTALVYILLVAFIQYGYIEYYWANKTVYRNRYDSFIEYVNVGALCQSGVRDVYLDADRDTAYAMQLALPDISIHLGAPEKYEKNVVILTNGKSSDVCAKFDLDQEYKAVSLDDNEILITNNQVIAGILSETLFVYEADTLVFDYVDFLYQHILGRAADPAGFQTNGLWLMNEGVEPSDLIMVLLNCDELQCRGYTSEQMAETICNGFWGYPGNKELVHTMALRLDSGESLEDVAGDLINSDKYFEVLESFGLRDDKADRLYSYVNRIYNHILERPADEIGATGFCDMIREGEITPDDLVNLLIDSEEHQGLGRSTEYTVIRLFMLYTNTFPELETVHWYAERIDSAEMSYRDLQETLSNTVAYHNIIMDYNIEEYI